MRDEVPIVVGEELLFAKIIELTNYAWHWPIVSGAASAVWDFNSGYKRKTIEAVNVSLNSRYIDAWTIVKIGRHH